MKDMVLCNEEVEFGSYLLATGERLWKSQDLEQSTDEQGVPQQRRDQDIGAARGREQLEERAPETSAW